jgi:TusA-related sulfurtransferase
MKQIDLRVLGDQCSASKSKVIEFVIGEGLSKGEEAEVILSDPDTWFAVSNLGDQLGYSVLSKERRGESEYIVIIRKN